ncbi:MAG: glycosyltransferase family 2 protein [Nitrospiraceae bacterium]|nr:glycosyltransferase family 2 protein [Nitrospiraceae bacterium]
MDSSPPEGTAPKVAVIVLNWNGLEDTAACLESLAKVAYKPVEIIVVDNGSIDGSQRFLRENYPWATLIETGQNLGFTGGNNVGIRHALERGVDYILLLNNDTVVAHDFLDALVKTAVRRPDVGILNPKIYYFDPPEMIWYAGGELSLYRGISKHFGFRQIDHGQFDSEQEVTFVTGCAFFIKREVVEAIGLLDDYFFCYSEDADWTIRTRKAGYKGFYVPSSRIWHKVGGSVQSAKSDFVMRMGTRNALYLVWKHTSKYQFIVFLAVFAVNWLLRNTISCIIRGNYRVIPAMVDGVRAFIAETKQRRSIMQSKKSKHDK